MSHPPEGASLDVCATVLLGARVAGPGCERSENLTSCLAALAAQTLPRASYKVVVVEQDEDSRLRDRLLAGVDELVFAYNPGPFNRGWGFNVAAARARSGVLCLLDVDMVVPPDSLARSVAAWRSGALAIRPYSELAFLNQESSDRVRRQLAERAEVDFYAPHYRGRRIGNSLGGCALWVDVSLYHQLRGYDERFEGWGWEDREFWGRLSSLTSIVTLTGRLLHLYHAKGGEESTDARANELRYEGLRAGVLATHRGDFGDINRYRSTTTAGAPQ